MDIGWDSVIRTHGMVESKSTAFPLGDIPSNNEQKGLSDWSITNNSGVENRRYVIGSLLLLFHSKRYINVYPPSTSPEDHTQPMCSPL